MLVLALFGCGPSPEALGELRDDHLRLVSEVRARLESLERPVTRHAGGDGEYAYDGHIDGLGWWSGRVDVEGTALVTGGGTVEAYTLDLVYTDVSLGDVELDGDVQAAIDIAASGLGIVFSYELIGDLRVRGAWSGEVTFDHTFTSDADGQRWSGTFAGEDAAALP